MTLTIRADTSKAEAFLDELGESMQTAVRPVAQAGSQVLYEAVQRNASAIGRKSGNLAASIYQAYARKESGEGKASYYVSWRTAKTRLDDKGKKIPVGLPRAPHGHLLEFGYIQRYAVYLGKDGQWHTAVRKEKQGQRLPRGATQAQKDAHYVLRNGGPKQMPAHPFVRPAEAQFPKAVEAMTAELWKRVQA